MSYDAKKGDWVQIMEVVLEPGERAPKIPKDTSQVPYVMKVKGFLTQDANIGDIVTIKTVIDRTVSGKLVAVNPRYDHSFGPPPNRFMNIGYKLRKILKEETTNGN